MNSKYQKYYDALKSVDFNNYVNKVTTSCEDLSTQIGKLESLISKSCTY
jgi:hypothetical protein